MAREKLAFWLMPAADAKATFASLVDELARRFEAPPFEPHVTLRGAELEQQHAIDVLETIAGSSAPLELQISGLAFSEKFTKTLYVQFASSRDASAMSDAIAQAVQSGGDYNFDPHLSLLYKTMPEAQKQELLREIKLPLDQVRFDNVKVVSVPASIEGPEDVHAWRTVAERRLQRELT